MWYLEPLADLACAVFQLFALVKHNEHVFLHLVARVHVHQVLVQLDTAHGAVAVSD